MKKALGLVLIIAIIFATKFWYQNLRGATPAIRPPRQKISETINTTNMPLTIPNGFSISIFASNLPSARVLRFDPNGNLLVSLTRSGRVVSLDKGGSPSTIVDGLTLPHGLAFDCLGVSCTLYIGETDQVVAYDYNLSNQGLSNRISLFNLPPRGNHFTRTLQVISFGGQTKLFTAVGSSCNVCVEQDSRRAKILFSNLDGSDLRDFATGLRNTVFFTPHPSTGELWGTDMGRDLIGDNLPPEEINIIKQDGNYGWPYCYGKNIHDDDFDPRGNIDCLGLQPSHIDFQAHSAPLGLAFIPDNWPPEYHDDLLVAYHGSWNRTVPTGYKIVRFLLDENGNHQETEDFISGWLLDNGESVGRPVDLAFDEVGNLFVSDDGAGVVYKVSPPTFLP